VGCVQEWVRFVRDLRTVFVALCFVGVAVGVRIVYGGSLFVSWGRVDRHGIFASIGPLGGHLDVCFRRLRLRLRLLIFCGSSSSGSIGLMSSISFRKSNFVSHGSKRR